MKFQPKHLQSFWNKKNILFVSLCLIFVIGIGVTIAWLTGYDGDVHYAFQGAFVDCEVQEEFDGTTKSNVRIKNTGNVDAFIRATYVASWVKDGTENSDSPVVYHTDPQKGTDYTVTLNTNNWLGANDGYWYGVENGSYKIVKSTEESPVFIQTLTDLGNAPAGYHLQVTVLAEAIQSNNDDAEPAFMDTWYTTNGNSQSRPTKAN